MSTHDELTYGQAAERLDEILRSIEDEQADIDELSKLVDEAAGLVKLCRDKIQAAEVQVTRIADDLAREASAATPAAPVYDDAPPHDDEDAPSYTDDDLPF